MSLWCIAYGNAPTPTGTGTGKGRSAWVAVQVGAFRSTVQASLVHGHGHGSSSSSSMDHKAAGTAPASTPSYVVGLGPATTAGASPAPAPSVPPSVLRRHRTSSTASQASMSELLAAAVSGERGPGGGSTSASSALFDSLRSATGSPTPFGDIASASDGHASRMLPLATPPRPSAATAFASGPASPALATSPGPLALYGHASGVASASGAAGYFPASSAASSSAVPPPLPVPEGPLPRVRISLAVTGGCLYMLHRGTLWVWPQPCEKMAALHAEGVGALASGVPVAVPWLDPIRLIDAPRADCLAGCPHPDSPLLFAYQLNQPVPHSATEPPGSPGPASTGHIVVLAAHANAASNGAAGSAAQAGDASTGISGGAARAQGGAGSRSASVDVDSAATGNNFFDLVTVGSPVVPVPTGIRISCPASLHCDRPFRVSVHYPHPPSSAATGGTGASSSTGSSSPIPAPAPAPREFDWLSLCRIGQPSALGVASSIDASPCGVMLAAAVPVAPSGSSSASTASGHSAVSEPVTTTDASGLTVSFTWPASALPPDPGLYEWRYYRGPGLSASSSTSTGSLSNLSAVSVAPVHFRAPEPSPPSIDDTSLALALGASGPPSASTSARRGSMASDRSDAPPPMPPALSSSSSAASLAGVGSAAGSGARPAGSGSAAPSPPASAVSSGVLSGSHASAGTGHGLMLTSLALPPPVTTGSGLVHGPLRGEWAALCPAANVVSLAASVRGVVAVTTSGDAWGFPYPPVLARRAKQQQSTSSTGSATGVAQAGGTVPLSVGIPVSGAAAGAAVSHCPLPVLILGDSLPSLPAASSTPSPTAGVAAASSTTSAGVAAASTGLSSPCAVGVVDTAHPHAGPASLAPAPSPAANGPVPSPSGASLSNGVSAPASTTLTASGGDSPTSLSVPVPTNPKDRIQLLVRQLTKGCGRPAGTCGNTGHCASAASASGVVTLDAKAALLAACKLSTSLDPATYCALTGPKAASAPAAAATSSS